MAATLRNSVTRYPIFCRGAAGGCAHSYGNSCDCTVGVFGINNCGSCSGIDNSTTDSTYTACMFPLASFVYCLLESKSSGLFLESFL